MPPYVYMMANRWNTVLYIGMTDALAKRAWEHRTGFYPDAFTWTYQCVKLVWFEEHEDGASAVTREQQMKEWKRAVEGEVGQGDEPDVAGYCAGV